MRTIIQSLGDVRRALFLMPRLFLATFACILAANTVIRTVFAPHAQAFLVAVGGSAHHYAPAVLGGAWRRPVVEWVGGIAKGFIATAIVVSVHRYVLIGEWRDRWPLLLQARDLRLALWLAVVRSILPVISLADLVLEPLGEVFSGIFGIAALLAGLIVLSRLMLIFPAVATDCRDVVRLSLGLTRTHVVKIMLLVAGLTFADLCLVVVPYWPIRRAIYRAAVGGTMALEPWAPASFLAATSLMEVLFVASMAAMASRLFRAFTAEQASG
jgi:hypothetical protein